MTLIDHAVVASRAPRRAPFLPFDPAEAGDDDAEVGARMLAAAIEPLPVGLLILRPSGMVRHANRSARAILARRDGFAIGPSGRLTILCPGGRARYAEFLEGRGPRSGIMKVGRREGPAYGVRLWRSADGHGLVIADPDAGTGEGADLLAVTMALSPASARAVAALATGEDMAVYAERAGVTANTVRYHLKQAFLATGTHCRADLVRIATSFLQGLRAFATEPTPSPRGASVRPRRVEIPGRGRGCGTPRRQAPTGSSCRCGSRARLGRLAP